MERIGKIHIYMGEGKGKTTCAAGLALRCAGSGQNVMIGQFLKEPNSGELMAFEDVDGVQFLQAPGFFGFTWNMTEQEKEEASFVYGSYLDALLFRIQQGKFRMIVLDEIIGALSAGLVDEDEFMDWLEQVPEEMEIVLTGRYPSERLMAEADYITEMKKIRHPYDQGLAARQGIEY